MARFGMYPEPHMELEISVHDFDHLKQAAQDAATQQLFLLDVRQPWETELAAISGGHLIPLEDLPDRAPEELNPDARIIVYCHHGRRSIPATLWLREQGFPHSQSLAGGIEAWSRSIDPSVPEYESP